MGGRGRGRGRGGAHPPSRVLGVVYEHLGVRGHVNIPPTVGGLVWVGWQNFLAHPGVNVAALQPALPTLEEEEQLLQDQLLEDQLEVEEG